MLHWYVQPGSRKTLALSFSQAALDFMRKLLEMAIREKEIRNI